MAEPFDPYLKWLGIPPKHQPPNDYRLLGIELFESDPDVIANAADQRMAHVKNFGTGRHSNLSQKILNEISAARVRLLNAREKAKYDAGLRRRLEEKRPSARKLPTAAPLPVLVREPVPVISVDTGESGDASQAAHLRGPRAQRPPWLVPAAVGAGTCVVGLVLALLLTGDGGTKDVGQATRGEPEANALASPEPSPGPRPSGQDQPDTPVGPDKPLQDDSPPADNPPQDDSPPADNSGQDDSPPADNLPPGNPPPAEDPPRDNLPPERSRPTEPPQDNPPVQKKVAEPDAQAKKEAEDSVRELYQEDLAGAKTPGQKLALAEKLKRDALGTKDDAAARFVLLEMAADFAADAEDVDRALSLIDQIGREYTVDVLNMKGTALQTVAEAVVGRRGALDVNALRHMILTARRLANEALSQGDVKAARRMADIALRPARRLKDPSLVAVLKSSIKELQQLEPRYDRVQKAVAVLDTDPNHPRANREAGTWYCLVAGDWGKGLRWLTKGDDVQLAELARDDLAHPNLAAEQVALGDRWWELGQTKKGLEESRTQQRAAHWYQQALPKLSGLDRRKLEKRLDEMGVKVGQHALQFDGQRSHVIVRNFAYPGQTPMTIEALVQPAGPVLPAPEQTVIGNLAASGLALGLYSGNWNFRFYGNYSYRSSVSSSIYLRSRCYSFSSTSIADTREWTHLAGVYDGKQVAFYVDGKLQRSFTSSTSYPLVSHKPSLLPFVIGAAPLGRPTPAGVPVGKFFHGAIKGIRVSNSALYSQDFEPPTQLENLAESTVLLFQFNEGTGNYLEDATGSNAVGAINGAEWIELDKAS